MAIPFNFVCTDKKEVEEEEMGKWEMEEGMGEGGVGGLAVVMVVVMMVEGGWWWR